MTNDQNSSNLSRRALLATGGSLLAMSATGAVPAVADDKLAASRCPFGFSLNMATVRGQKLALSDQVEIAAKAGYDAVEPWVEEIKHYKESGGSLSDLKRRIAELGLVVPSAIGFGDWINDDPTKRAAGLEQWRRDAELVTNIGGIRMAAPPSGARDVSLDLRHVADRYRKLLELSVPLGIVPELEMWGFSKTLSRMSEIAYVLVETGHKDACGLLDVFHIYKGGSDFAGVRVFNGSALHVLHMNDFPLLPRDKVTDADRVYPGDGAAPILTLLRDLNAIGYTGKLSLEVFNHGYWKQDALTVARTGCNKMKAIVEKALA